MRKRWEMPWFILLSGLLSSYSYKDPQELPPAVVRAKTSHLLRASGRSYILSSSESLKSEIPTELINGLGATQQVLRDAGYDTRLIQCEGRIFIAIRSPEGTWRAAPVNPASPGAMIAVLINDILKDMVYDDITDLAKDNNLMDEGH